MSGLAPFLSFLTQSFKSRGQGLIIIFINFHNPTEYQFINVNIFDQRQSFWVRGFKLARGYQTNLQEHGARVQAISDDEDNVCKLDMIMLTQGGVSGVPARLPGVPVWRNYRNILRHFPHGVHLCPWVDIVRHFCDECQEKVVGYFRDRMYTNNSTRSTECKKW